MNKTELELYSKIIESVETSIRRNKYLIDGIYNGDKNRAINSCLYEKEYTYLDYLDGRKNLIQIDNYCRYTGEKVSKNKIKKELQKYFNF